MKLAFDGDTTIKLLTAFELSEGLTCFFDPQILSRIKGSISRESAAKADKISKHILSYTVNEDIRFDIELTWTWPESSSD